MAATQRDVALLAGVCQRTVSRCFLQPDGVDPETRRKVLEAARRIGYRPNLAARTVRKGRSECVALLRDAELTHNNVHSSLVWSVQKRLKDHSLQVTLGDLPERNAGEPNAFSQPMADGMLIPCHNRMSDAVETYLRSLPIPAVWINTLGVADSVCSDDNRAGREATEHLLGLGHRHIAFFDRAGNSDGAQGRYCNCRERLAGYRQAMVAAGLTPELLCAEGQDAMEAAMRFCRRFVHARERPTALVICRKQEAQALVYAAQACHGIRVPQDLSMIVFSDEPLWTFPRITALVAPWEGMGTMAVDMLIRKLRDGEGDAPPRLLPMEFSHGTTTAAPSAG